VFFDMSPLDLATLVILAVLLFGPDKLPEVIQNVSRIIRKVRALSENAKQEVRSELGPAFKDFEFEDLRPKTFVHKHVLDNDALGLDGIRSALDPRAELAEITDAVRDAGHAPAELDRRSPPGTSSQHVGLAKDGGLAAPTRSAPDLEGT
jgi:sec-independent protein translocase protein TatB